MSEDEARLSEQARRVRTQHERITLARNGEPEAVLLSVDDLEDLEMTLRILADTDAVARVSESLAAPGRHAALSVNPQRVGKPLFGPLGGCDGARRGTYRIDENLRVVHVLDIDRRSDIYHRPQP